MNTKLIIATLVLGSSTFAMAAPAADVTVTATARGTTTVVRDHREPVTTQPVYTHPIIVREPVRTQPIIVREPVYTHPIIVREPVHTHPIIVRGPIVTQPVIWHGPVFRTVTLASSLNLAAGRTTIHVGAQMGRFATLKLDAAGGRTRVEQVIVKFADGQRQVIGNLDRTLVGNDCLTLDLDGGRRAIRSIVVVGNEINNGFRRERGMFNLTAV